MTEQATRMLTPKDIAKRLAISERSARHVT